MKLSQEIDETCDGVYTPQHYTSGLPCEAIVILECVAKQLQETLPSYNIINICNSLKYILRAGKKNDAIQDLKKAHNYLHRAIYGTWFEGENLGPTLYREIKNNVV